MWILISWVLQKPADLDLHCFQEKPADQDPYCLQDLIYIWFHTVFERIICLSTERYQLFFFLRTSKIFYGQVHFGFLLAPGQVENFTISTPLPVYTHLPKIVKKINQVSANHYNRSDVHFPKNNTGYSLVLQSDENATG